ncbi:putative lipocalin-like domain protein [Sulfitobacter noctilucae]|uniref:hypothetical protein n=1 Tax=Sulfitobacter noctilucae TaxID=1342302 RepID=UPI00046911ED|nr:hypothetical protein [Sulfitobacter noctilucae]KIN60366.1 putative lipocalin-like domain protein [Sulfitobacter noctilucae]
MNWSNFRKRDFESHTKSTGRALRLRRWIAPLASAVLIAACAATTPMPDVQIGLRNPTVPLGGTSRFDAARFAGEWHTVACSGVCATAERYTMATDAVYLRQTAEGQTPYSIAAPGVLKQIGGTDTLVVMWVDEGFRTAAVGDADGGWAAILDRRRAPGVDRVKAAREILDFNGWDISKLRMAK